MSTISDACGIAIKALGSAAGQTLLYRTTPAGSWTSLSNAFLEQGPPAVIGYDEQRTAILAPMTALLKVAAGGVHLTPGVGGAQIKDQTSTVWQVVGTAHTVGQSVYELQRAIVQSQGPARGTAS